MERRDFVRSTLAAGATLAGVPSSALAASSEKSTSSEAPREFRLKYAPHFGMFKAHTGDDLVAQLEFMRAEGFTALEDNGMKGRSVADQELIGKTLQRLGMQMGVFVAHDISWTEANLTTGDAAARDLFLKQVRESVDVAKRVNATWITVVPGHVQLRLDMGYQTANIIEAYKRAAAIFEPHGLVMAPVATSNSSTRGRVKLPHLRGGGTGWTLRVRGALGNTCGRFPEAPALALKLQQMAVVHQPIE